MEATAFWVTELYDEWTIDFYHYECCGQLLFIANRNTPGMSTRASNGGDAEICPIERDVTLWGDTMKLMTLFADMCCAHWLYIIFNQHQPDPSFSHRSALAHRSASLIAPILQVVSLSALAL